MNLQTFKSLYFQGKTKSKVKFDPFAEEYICDIIAKNDVSLINEFYRLGRREIGLIETVQMMELYNFIVDVGGDNARVWRERTILLCLINGLVGEFLSVRSSIFGNMWAKSFPKSVAQQLWVLDLKLFEKCYKSIRLYFTEDIPQYVQALTSLLSTGGVEDATFHALLVLLNCGTKASSIDGSCIRNIKNLGNLEMGKSLNQFLTKIIDLLPSSKGQQLMQAFISFLQVCNPGVAFYPVTELIKLGCNDARQILTKYISIYERDEESKQLIMSYIFSPNESEFLSNVKILENSNIENSEVYC